MREVIGLCVIVLYHVGAIRERRRCLSLPSSSTGTLSTVEKPTLCPGDQKVVGYSNLANLLDNDGDWRN
jgi:hypothetical protein